MLILTKKEILIQRYVRVPEYEYGDDWVYAVKLIYKNLLREKK